MKQHKHNIKRDKRDRRKAKSHIIQCNFSSSVVLLHCSVLTPFLFNCAFSHTFSTKNNTLSLSCFHHSIGLFLSPFQLHTLTNFPSLSFLTLYQTKDSSFLSTFFSLTLSSSSFIRILRFRGKSRVAKESWQLQSQRR